MAAARVPLKLYSSRTVSQLISVFEANRYCQRDLFLVVGFLQFLHVKMEEGLSATKILYEVRKRPKKAKPKCSGGNYYCVQKCKSTQNKVDNTTKIKTDIFFHLPKTPKEESNGFKVYPGFGKEQGKINSM